MIKVMDERNFTENIRSQISKKFKVLRNVYLTIEIEKIEILVKYTFILKKRVLV
jgi:hypothetical protein